MLLFSKKDRDAGYDFKARVQCNESVELGLAAAQPPVHCRLRELNWTGFTLDQLPIELKDTLLSADARKISALFRLPRDFGRIEVQGGEIAVSQYDDIVDGRAKLQAAFTLADQPQLEQIREFVSYRNRRFNRYYSSRKAGSFLKTKTVLAWFVLFPAICLIILAVFFRLKAMLLG